MPGGQRHAPKPSQQGPRQAVAAGSVDEGRIADAGPVSGRVLVADADGVTLDVAGDRRRFGYAALGAGVVQVEFGHPHTELGATGDGH